MINLDYNVTSLINQRFAKAGIPILADCSEYNNRISLRSKQKNKIEKTVNQIKDVKETGLASQDPDALIVVWSTKLR